MAATVIDCGDVVTPGLFLFARVAQRSGALVSKRGCPRDRGVRAVSGNEVNDRCVMLQEQTELIPAAIGLQRLIVRRCKNLGAQQVERRNTDVTATRDIERRQVER